MLHKHAGWDGESNKKIITNDKVIQFNIQLLNSHKQEK